MAKTENKTEAQNPKLLDEKIKSGKIGGIYCFFGEEEYMADYYIKKIAGEYMGGDGDLDCAFFDSESFDINSFRDAISSYPVMGDYKIIVLKNADGIKFKSGEKEELMSILRSFKGDIGDYACLIFKMKSLSDPALDKPEKTSKKSSPNLAAFLKENASLFEFRENPPASLLKWIAKIAASEQVEISDDTAAYLLKLAGPKMYPLKNELDKLTRFAKAENRAAITKEDIDLLVTKKTELEAFELTNAILDKKYGKAMESLEKLKSLKEDPGAVLGQMARYFCDLLIVHMAASSGIADSFAISKKTGIHEYRVKLSLNSLGKYRNPAEFINKSLNLCRECDRKQKSASLSDFGLLENLLFEVARL